MASAVRMSAFMVNCSMCTEGVDISMMGDHVCKPTLKPTLALEPQSSNTQNKGGRLPPARLDTKAANRPFTHQDHLAPVSASSNSNGSSLITAPNHNTIHKVSDGENESVVEVRPDGHQPFIGSNEASGQGRHLPAPQQYAATDPRYAPVSSRSVAGSGLLDKMNTIAPGPFGVRRDTEQKLAEKASSEDVLAALPLVTSIKGHHSRSSTASSMRSHSSKASSSSSNYTVATQPPKPVANLGGYRAFSPSLDSEFVSSEPRPFALLGAGSRSNTFPNVPTQQSFGIPRRPSDSSKLRRPSNVELDNNEELDGNTFVRTSPPKEAGRRNLSISGKPPPRGLSFSHGRDISAINLAAEFGSSNPFHTSTVSQSSDASNESGASKDSSRSSPPSSIDPQTRRKPSVAAALDAVTGHLEQAIRQEPGPMSPPRKQIESRTVTSPLVDVSLLAPESPMDPAIHGGRLSPMPNKAFPVGARGLDRPTPLQDPCQGRRPSAPALALQQHDSALQQRPPPSHGTLPTGGPTNGLPSRPNAPLMAQNGFPQQGRPPQHAPPSNKVPPPQQQYIPYRSPTTSMFPTNQPVVHPQGPPGRRPSHANLPSPHNEFPPGRRPSQANLPSLHLPSPGHQEQSHAGRSTPNGNRPTPDLNFPEGRRPSQARPLQPPPVPADSERPTTSSGRPTTAKGDCRGCGKAITGKSVSSADGRLTGRYHKECFVCKTCSSPFPSAEFYVIRDSPYCEEHYHRLNNSVCAARDCGRGIEGEFLETERRAKYHPGCLRCFDCREVLRGDYFEVRGGVFCERDALRHQQMPMQGRGGRGGRGRGGPMGMGMSRMEKRSTRLMMM